MSFQVRALAEPARRNLYLYVAAQAEAISRDQAATALQLPRHVVKFHLDRLVAEGLLEVEFRRLSGRQGPGAGRPAKLYRRAARQVTVSLPERRFDLAGQILADAVHEASTGAPILAAVAEAAASAGRRAGAEARASTGSSVAGALAACGYEPRLIDRTMILANCPFHPLAVEHTELVCGLNLEFIRAMTSELGGDEVGVRLDPGPGRCCVTLQLAAPPSA